MKNKSIIVILLGLIVMVFGFINPLGFGKEEKKEETKPTEEKKEEKKEEDFSGLYYNDEFILKIYKTNDKEFKYTFAKDNMNIMMGIGDISGNTAKASFMDDTFTFTLTDNGVNVETNVKDIKSGLYLFNKDYTINDYYQDNYGDLKYINGEITGLYELNNTKLYVLQRNDDMVSFFLENEVHNVIADTTKDGKGNYVANILDDKYTLKIESGKAVFTSTTKELNGTYNKTSGLTIEEIIKRF